MPEKQKLQIPGGEILLVASLMSNIGLKDNQFSRISLVTFSFLDPLVIERTTTLAKYGPGSSFFSPARVVSKVSKSMWYSLSATETSTEVMSWPARLKINNCATRSSPERLWVKYSVVRSRKGLG